MVTIMILKNTKYQHYTNSITKHKHSNYDNNMIKQLIHISVIPIHVILE